MLLPSDPAERDAFGLQSEMVHVTLGYHLDRVKHGHPFALAPDVSAHVGKHITSMLLSDKVREFGLNELRLVDELRNDHVSPIHLISKGVVASVWDSLGHMQGVGLERVEQPRYFPLIADHEVSDIRRELLPYAKNEAYRGMGTIHSGFHIGIGFMTHFAALAEGLPPGRSLDAAGLVGTLSKTSSLGLGLLQLEQAVMSHQQLFREKVMQWLSPDKRFGVNPEKIREFTDGKAPGCPSRMAPTKRAIRILRRHGLEAPAEDASAIEILCRHIQAYVHEQFEILRAELPLGNVQAMPLFDRRVYARAIPVA